MIILGDLFSLDYCVYHLKIHIHCTCMLWFKFVFGIKFFFPGFYDEYEAIKNNNKTGLKNIKPKTNLNHNIHIHAHIYKLKITSTIYNGIKYCKHCHIY